MFIGQTANFLCYSTCFFFDCFFHFVFQKRTPEKRFAMSSNSLSSLWFSWSSDVFTVSVEIKRPKLYIRRRTWYKLYLSLSLSINQAKSTFEYTKSKYFIVALFISVHTSAMMHSSFIDRWLNTSNQISASTQWTLIGVDILDSSGSTRFDIISNVGSGSFHSARGLVTYCVAYSSISLISSTASSLNLVKTTDGAGLLTRFVLLFVLEANVIFRFLTAFCQHFRSFRWIFTRNKPYLFLFIRRSNLVGFGRREYLVPFADILLKSPRIVFENFIRKQVCKLALCQISLIYSKYSGLCPEKSSNLLAYLIQCDATRFQTNCSWAAKKISSVSIGLVLASPQLYEMLYRIENSAPLTNERINEIIKWHEIDWVGATVIQYTMCL